MDEPVYGAEAFLTLTPLSRYRGQKLGQYQISGRHRDYKKMKYIFRDSDRKYVGWSRNIACSAYNNWYKSHNLSVSLARGYWSLFGNNNWTFSYMW